MENTQILMDSVLANLEYWKRVKDISCQDQRNLLRLVSLGMESAQCLVGTINLVQKIFPLIEEWGQYQLWISTLINAEQSPNSAPVFVKRAMLVGKLFEIKRDYSNALIWYQESEVGVDLILDQNFKLNLYSGLCFVYWGLGERYKIDEYKKKVDLLIMSSEELKGETEILVMLGQLDLISGDYQKARKKYLKIIRVFKENGEHLKFAASAVNLALSIYLGKEVGEMRQCLSYLAQAAQIQLSLGKLQEFQRLELLKGLLYFKIGERSRAIKVLKNIDVQEQIEEGELMWKKLNQGLLFGIIGDRISAAENLNDCLLIAEQAGDYSVRKLAEQGILDFC